MLSTSPELLENVAPTSVPLRITGFAGIRFALLIEFAGAASQFVFWCGALSFE